MTRGTLFPPLPYDPPTQATDARICGRCLRRTGSWSNHKLWPILNTKSGKYHSGGEYGETDCGIDSTKDWFLWPL